jgi:Haem-NO-binding
VHGLIFVTWEKYLLERFGSSFLHQYRATIGETPASAPLASRVYDDATLLAGVGVATNLSHLPTNTLLREYGRYFIINGLTNHLCSYLLGQVKSGRELLLIMRRAHEQMGRTPDSITPPLFTYEVLASDPRGFTLVYDSVRHLCPVLHGCIEGAAERYGEKVYIVETACMSRDAAACRFNVRFFAPSSGPLARYETPEQIVRRNAKRQLAEIVLSVLPTRDGITLQELQSIMQLWQQLNPQQSRPSVLLESLRYLQHAGLVASSANQRGDILANRRYWRAPTSD